MTTQSVAAPPPSKKRNRCLHINAKREIIGQRLPGLFL